MGENLQLTIKKGREKSRPKSITVHVAPSTTTTFYTFSIKKSSPDGVTD